MRKIIALALFAALAANTVACGDKDIADDETLGGGGSESKEIVNINSDDLPTDLNFNGETVTFLYREEVVDEFYVEEANGDVVNDAIYNSQKSVEERLGVNIEVITQPGQSGNDRNTYMNLIRSSVMSNDDEYDWVDLMVGNAPVMMQEGIFQNLLDNKYINPDKPYYMSGLADLCTIDNKLYFISGDASLGYLQDSFCIFFNKSLAEEYSLGNLYELVESGDWTLDKLMEFSATVAQDVDQNGIYDDNDILGFRIYDQNHISGFIASTELDLCKKDSSGEWKFDMSSQRDSTIIETLNKLIYQTEGAFLNHISDCTKFANGEVLFITAQFDDAVTYLRDMIDAYGILPYPKLDKSQENYHSNARTTHNSFSMPVTCQSSDAAGAVMEALSSSNYESVTPAYFEVALKTKFTTDEESAKMYDIIRGSMQLDFGFIFSNIMENPVTNVYINSVKGDGFASTLASYETKITEALAKYIETVKGIE